LAVGTDQRAGVALTTSVDLDDAASAECTNSRPDETSGPGAKFEIGRGGFDGGHGPGTYRIAGLGRVRTCR
jgi:hypothetical protein